MEKSILAKRKAQKLAREGQIRQACEEMRKCLREGEVDPYDHVYLGDLLLRLGEPGEAADAWQEAVASYRQMGLYRNAIAICKKILRLNRGRAQIHRTLGELLLQDGLPGEAAGHLLAFLDAQNRSVDPSPAVMQTLETLAGISPLKEEQVLRLAEHCTRAAREDLSVGLLRELAEQLAESGMGELSAEVHEKAEQAEAAFLAGQSAEGMNTRGEPASDEGAADPDPASITERPPTLEPVSVMTSVAGSAPADTCSDPEGWPAGPQSDPEPGSEPAAFPDPPAGSEPMAGPDPTTGPEPTAEPESVGSPEPLEPAPQPDQELRNEPDPPGPVEPPGDTGRHALSAATPPGRPGFQVEHFPEPERSRLQEGASLRDRAQAAFDRGAWEESKPLFEEILHAQALDREVIDRLIEISRRLQDPSGEATYLNALGDAWIEEEELAHAVEAFRGALRLDPENATARRRLGRLHAMGIPGAEVEERDSIGGVIRNGEATVQVSGAPRGEGPEWVDLNALLEEFSQSVRKQIDASDFQSHYDLAVSHRCMGLFEEAVEEADRVLAHPDLPLDMVGSTRELKGQCLMELMRVREAIHEFREVLEQEAQDGPRRWSLLYHLGRALESAGEWGDAIEAYERIGRGSQGYLDCEERLRVCREHSTSPSPPCS